jgi:pimeloyl-ACP methyl ester carboxylesterase
MANFVLVHGAWGGAWCWDPVVPLLTAQGHRVLAPDLTGLGARAHLAGQAVNLSTHVQDVVAVLESHRLEQVVLVGHSYGGMVVTGAAARAGARIASLVYLDAFVPADGQSLWDLGNDHTRTWMLDCARQHGGQVARLRRENDFARNETRFGLQPLACFTEGVRRGGEEDHIAHRHYIWASGYDPSPFGANYRRLQSEPGWQVASIATGHNTMLENPAETALLLLATIPN